jgi:Zn-finger nucleic acid-binding protein
MFGRRAQASRRQCPKCDQPMHYVSVKGAEIDLCSGCSGMWFDPGELSRAVGLKFRESADGRALAGADRTEHRCPACAVPSTNGTSETTPASASTSVRSAPASSSTAAS